MYVGLIIKAGGGMTPFLIAGCGMTPFSMAWSCMKPILPSVCGMGGFPKIGDDFRGGGGWGGLKLINQNSRK